METNQTVKLVGIWWLRKLFYNLQHMQIPIDILLLWLLLAIFLVVLTEKSLFHGTSSVPMDVGHLPLLARLSGTLCPRTCGIWMFLRTVTGSHSRRFYFRSTSVFSALEVFFTRMCYINLHLTLTLTVCCLRVIQVHSCRPIVLLTTRWLQPSTRRWPRGLVWVPSECASFLLENDAQY